MLERAKVTGCRYWQEIAMQALCEHAHLSGQRLMIVLLEAARDQLGIHIQQLTVEHVGDPVTAMLLHPLVPATDRQSCICDYNALTSQVIQPFWKSHSCVRHRHWLALRNSSELLNCLEQVLQ